MANEKRLIPLNKRIIYGGDVFNSLMSEKNWSATEAADFVSAFRTVDAVEVVHGKWLFKHNPITDPKGYFIRIVCSECNLHTGQKSNYCPNCGAKMEGERREGE